MTQRKPELEPEICSYYHPEIPDRLLVMHGRRKQGNKPYMAGMAPLHFCIWWQGLRMCPTAFFFHHTFDVFYPSTKDLNQLVFCYLDGWSRFHFWRVWIPSVGVLFFGKRSCDPPFTFTQTWKYKEIPKETLASVCIVLLPNFLAN